MALIEIQIGITFLVIIIHLLFMLFTSLPLKLHGSLIGWAVLSFCFMGVCLAYIIQVIIGILTGKLVITQPSSTYYHGGGGYSTSSGSTIMNVDRNKSPNAYKRKLKFITHLVTIMVIISALILVSVIFISAPTAKFRYSAHDEIIPEKIYLNDSIKFYEESTGELDITSRHWDFGDGSTFYQWYKTQHVYHTYDKAGTYTVSLKVTNAIGMSDIFSNDILITED